MLKIQILASIAVLLAIQMQSVALADVPLPPSPSKSNEATDDDAKNPKPLWKSRVREMPDTAATASTAKAAKKGRFDPVELDEFLKNTSRKIKRNWFPPKCEAKAVTVQFTLNDAGHVSNLKVTKSSGLEIADKAAMQAVQNAQPFHKLPTGANATEDLLFHFDYNIFDEKHPSLKVIESSPAAPQPSKQPEASAKQN
ncbi:MAG: TonB family protein [Candidatus Obscuribacterales bacterium]